MLTQTPQWVAIYTRSRAEKRVAQLLAGQDFECYLPQVERCHRWSDRYKMVVEPLFRSYVFVKIKNTDVIPIRSTPGVCFIVSFGGEIVTVPQAQIDAIERLVASKQELFVHETASLTKGKKVDIVEGHFAGMSGILLSGCKDGNFAVRIDAIGATIVTTVDRLLLRPAKPQSQPKVRKITIR